MRSRSSSVHCTALAFNVKSGPWTVQAVPVAWRSEAVIGLMCLCLVSPHADAHTHEECGPVQTVPFIPDLAYTAVLAGSSLRDGMAPGPGYPAGRPCSAVAASGKRRAAEAGGQPVECP